MLKTAAITLLLLGDLNFTGMQYLTEFSKAGYDPGFSFREVMSVVQQADITVANLEGPLTFADWSPEAEKKTWRFRHLPVFTQGIKGAGIDVLLLGNNHIADAGEQGIRDTINAIREQGLSWVPPPQEGPLVIKKNGIVLELWNADVFSLKGSHPWAIDENEFCELIAKYAGRKENHIVIAFIHDHYRGPGSEAAQEKFIAQLRNSGVHWVVMGGEHRPSFLRTDSRGGVHYGLGDFIFGCECSGGQKGKALVLFFETDSVVAREFVLTPGSPGNGFITVFDSP